MVPNWTSSHIAGLRRGMLVTVFLVASLVLVLGWGVGIDSITRLLPGLAAMVPSTALCFMCLSGVLIGANANSGSLRLKVALRLAGIGVALTATADLAVIASGRANGIDSLVLPQLSGRTQDAMAVATALSFLCAAACTVLLTFPGRSIERLFTPLASIGLALCSIALVGYLFDSAALYEFFVFTAIALHTAVLFLLLFFALMLANPRQGWIWLLLGNGIGSAGARRLFPFIVAGPLLFIFCALAATRASLFSPDFRASLLAIAMITVGLWAILGNARIENRAQHRLANLVAELEIALADKDLLLREVYHRVNNNLQQIVALMAIEGAKFDDPRFASSFNSLGRRVKALGMVHQLLIRSPQPSEIEMTRFLDELRQSIIESHGLDDRSICLTMEARPERLQIDVAISMGLVLNELVANAIEHAFVGRSSGTISVTVGDDPEDTDVRIMTVRDDGIGGDAASPVGEFVSGSGSQIVQAFVTQLRGTMDVHRHDGTTVVLRFPRKVREGER